MFYHIVICVLFIQVINADVGITKGKTKNTATLKPMSACCDIPELGDLNPQIQCSKPKPPAPCDEIQCAFEKSGFLTDTQTLNKEAYRNHLHKWSETHKGWKKAIDRAIQDCVDDDPRQYLPEPCKAYDVFTCTSISMIKKCPDEAWKCGKK